MYFKISFTKLEFYCKNHNTLCCVSCISRIKEEGYGQHSDCDVCHIDNIKDEKKNKLKENITHLEELYNQIEKSINVLQNSFSKGPISFLCMGISSCPASLMKKLSFLHCIFLVPLS